MPAGAFEYHYGTVGMVQQCTPAVDVADDCSVHPALLVVSTPCNTTHHQKF